MSLNRRTGRPFIRTRPLPVLSSTNTHRALPEYISRVFQRLEGLKRGCPGASPARTRRWNAANALSSLLRVASCMRLWSDPSMSGKSLAYCRKRSALLSERDALLVLLPGRFALFESGVIEQALLRQHIVQPDVPCPAQVGACAICADQLGMLCYRGIVWRGGGHRYSPCQQL